MKQAQQIQEKVEKVELNWRLETCDLHSQLVWVEGTEQEKVLFHVSGLQWRPGVGTHLFKLQPVREEDIGRGYRDGRNPKEEIRDLRLLFPIIEDFYSTLLQTASVTFL